MAISVNNANRQETELKLTPYDSEFVQWIHDELTMYGEIPYSIPQRQIIEIIKRSARFFYKQYAGSWQHKYLVLRLKDLKQHVRLPKESGLHAITIKLPPQVRIVSGINRLGNDFKFRQDDFFTPLGNGISPNGMISGTSSTSPLQTWGMGNAGYGIDNHLYLIENVVKLVEQNFIDAVFGKSIPYDYVIDASTITLKETINTDIVLSVKCDIEIKHLYNNEYFRRHALSLAHQALFRKIGGITIELPGGATITADAVCNKMEDQQLVEDYIRSGSGMGALIMKRN